MGEDKTCACSPGNMLNPFANKQCCLSECSAPDTLLTVGTQMAHRPRGPNRKKAVKERIHAVASGKEIIKKEIKKEQAVETAPILWLQAGMGWSAWHRGIGGVWGSHRSCLLWCH